MQGELYTVYHLTLDPANFDAFKSLAEKIVDATRQEADTITYEYLVNADRTIAHIIERYQMDGVLPHVNETFSPYAAEFLSLATIDKLYVYGEPTAEIRAKLDTFGANYLTPFAGFSR
jgi:quinol monooxygenase YgiN